MSPPSLKRHSASAHFADKKGIQLSPSIYLPRSFVPSFHFLPLSPTPCSARCLSSSTYLYRARPLPFSFRKKVSRRSLLARFGDERDSWSSSAYQTITNYVETETRQGNPQFCGCYFIPFLFTDAPPTWLKMLQSCFPRYEAGQI